jgi:hypothetical protein
MAYFRTSASDVGLPDVTKATVWIDCVDGSTLEPLTLTGVDLERLYYVLGQLEKRYFDIIASEITLPLHGSNLVGFKQGYPMPLEDAVMRYMDSFLMEIDQDIRAYVPFLKACEGLSSKGDYAFVQIRLETL